MHNQMKYNMVEEMTDARIAGISRLRMETDGPGIRTLVHLSGCRLDCAYCLKGTCPACDAQLERINLQLEAKRLRGEAVIYDGLSETYENRMK